MSLNDLMPHRMIAFLPIAALLTLPFTTPAADTPAASFTIESAAEQTVPQGAQRVPLSTITMRASCSGPVTISSITLRHSGLGSVSDIARIYAIQGNTRITRGQSLPENNPLVLRTRALKVAACKTVSVGLFADLESTASSGGEHRIDVLSIETNVGTIIPSTEKPLRHPIVSVTPGGNQPTIGAVFQSIPPVTFGKDRIIARLLLTGGSAADQEVRSILFTNKGSASNSDVRNLYLAATSGKRISKTALQLDGRTVRLEFDPPLFLGRNEDRVVVLRADMLASRRKTVRWSIEEPSDIFAVKARRGR